MPAKLLVVDSPRKAKTLARWLGPDFRLIACSGPLKALPLQRMGIDVRRGFSVEYEVPRARQKEVRALGAAAESAREVWLAAPPGATGEAFCSLVAGALPAGRLVRRIELVELTPDSVAAALRQGRPIDEALAGAVEARLVLDRLARPAFSWCCGEKRAPYGGPGRLEAVALALLCEGRGASVAPRSRARFPASGPGPRASTTAPLALVGLIEACHEAYGLSARQTLRIADRLHEGVDLPGGRLGLITSPWSDGPGATGAEALRPATNGPDPSTIDAHLSRGESRLYRLIWDRYAWSKVSPRTRSATGPHDFASGTEAGAGEPWTEPALVRELMECGVGPAAACAHVPHSLAEAGLVEGGPSSLRPTSAGRRAGARLREFFPDLASVTAASELEARIGALVRGELNRLGLFGPFWKRIELDLERVSRQRGRATEVPPGGPPCERCGAPTLERLGPYGAFRACSRYPSCTSTLSLEAAPRAAEGSLLCPRCSRAPIVERKGPTGRLFYGCRAYPKCRFTTHHRPVAEPCPQCGLAFLLEKETPRDGRVRVCAGCRYRAPVTTTA